MIAIAAVSENWGIGREGALLFSLPADLRRFRALTVNKTVVMGRRTLESLPHGKPLPQRRNIVLTSSRSTIEGAETAADLDALLRLIADTPPQEVYLIGGGEVYAALLPHCERAEITRIHADAEADTFFPDLDRDSAWRIAQQSEMQEENGLRFQFLTYVRL